MGGLVALCALAATTIGAFPPSTPQARGAVTCTLPLAGAPPAFGSSPVVEPSAPGAFAGRPIAVVATLPLVDTSLQPVNSRLSILASDGTVVATWAIPEVDAGPTRGSATRTWVPQTIGTFTARVTQTWVPADAVDLSLGCTTDETATFEVEMAPRISVKTPTRVNLGHRRAFAATLSANRPNGRAVVELLVQRAGKWKRLSRVGTSVSPIETRVSIPVPRTARPIARRVLLRVTGKKTLEGAEVKKYLRLAAAKLPPAVRQRPKPSTPDPTAPFADEAERTVRSRVGFGSLAYASCSLLDSALAKCHVYWLLSRKGESGAADVLVRKFPRGYLATIVSFKTYGGS